LLAVREYIPLIGVVMIGFCWVDVNPPGPVQLHWVTPVPRPNSFNVSPLHGVNELGAADTEVGMVEEFTTTVVLAVAVHPLVAVTVTV
jgi:hypothetical protein